MSHPNLTEVQKQDLINQAVQQDGKFKQCRIIYSLETPLHEKLSENAIIVECGKYKSAVLEGATYLEMAVLANDMIGYTKNYHNIFLENITYVCEKNGIEVYTFTMGS